MSKQILWSLAALATGYLLDLLVGDPQWLPHPVRLIGWLITKTEEYTRRRFPKSVEGERRGGMVTALWVVLLSFAVPFFLLLLCRWISPWLGYGVESLMCFQILATKSLKVESMRVYAPLKAGDLPAARKAVSRIVGRDTEQLTAVQVAKAAVETVAENTSDGVIAPMLFLALGGAPLGFLYKGINTLDSMIGYKNAKYLHFGRFAAKLDDWANYIPARLSAQLMIAAAYLLGPDFDGKEARRIYQRDHANHSSPNSAHTESVCAGALHIQLAGDNFYFGKLVKKPTIGDDIRPVEPEDIPRANRLLYLTAALGLAGSCLVKGLFLLL